MTFASHVSSRAVYRYAMLCPWASRPGKNRGYDIYPCLTINLIEVYQARQSDRV
jgi:hypothetical protein